MGLTCSGPDVLFQKVGEHSFLPQLQVLLSVITITVRNDSTPDHKTRIVTVAIFNVFYQIIFTFGELYCSINIYCIINFLNYNSWL